MSLQSKKRVHNRQAIQWAFLTLLLSGCGVSPEEKVLHQAENLVSSKQLELAYKQLEDFHVANPKAYEARQMQIVILCKLNRLEDAILMYKQLSAQTSLATFLNEAIRNEDPVVRANVCELIGTTKPSNSVYLFSKVVHDPNLKIRRAAVHYSGDFKGKKVLALLKEALVDPAWQVRADAADSLERLDDPRAAEPLFQTMLDRDGYVQFKARHALEAIIDDSNLSVYRRALKNSNRRVSIAAALALATRNDDEAVTVLLQAVRDSDASVRADAARSLARIGDRSARPLLRESLFDPNASVRASAALALAQLGDIISTNQLAFLAEQDPAEVVRLAAAQACQILNPPQPPSSQIAPH